MKHALLVLAACGNAEPKQAPTSIDKPREAIARSWPVKGAPALPPELADLAWPPSMDDIAAKLPQLATDDGIAIESGRAFAIAVPSYYPRIWLSSDIDQMTLEAAWGPLARDREGQALWFAPNLRVRFDAQHPTPRFGRGIELSSYVSTLDRVENLPELVDAEMIPPGEWDRVPIKVTVVGKQLRFMTGVDAAPVDEAAVRARLDAQYGAPVEEAGRWSYAKGLVTLRRVDESARVEITYLAP
jgi:hypothetical protein